MNYITAKRGEKRGWRSGEEAGKGWGWKRRKGGEGGGRERKGR